MRTLMFTAGLFLAAQPAFAQTDTVPVASDTDRIALTNGCVYAPNLLTQDNAWSLIYTEAGTTVQCALTIYGQISDQPDVASMPATVAAPTEPVAAPEETAPYVTRSARVPTTFDQRVRTTITPRYMVGVFR
ncbi:MAG: hypothetical protein AAFY39_07835 [Pseudomonadota bacterium]